ncbi:hypothetical protein B0H13DRAFT_1875490 [Mycena leptocephala]|nr:hypothetical protein B0H13DRAFT_1875490 [Mycena leptocephala]
MVNDTAQTESNSQSHTPRHACRQTARMSTGGKPPARYIPEVKLVDEAEEADEEEDEEENLDEFEADFIDDGDVNDEEEIPWSRSPSPGGRPKLDDPVDLAIPAAGPVDLPAILKRPKRVSKPNPLPPVEPMTTRSRTKSSSSSATTLEDRDIASKTAKPTTTLQTKFYKGSRADKNTGLKSLSVSLGPGPDDSERQLDFVNNKSSTTMVDLDSEEYQEFLRYKAKKASVSPLQPGANIVPTSLGSKGKGKSVTIQPPSWPTPVRDKEDEEDEEPVVSPKKSKEATGRSVQPKSGTHGKSAVVSKRKRIESDPEEEPPKPASKVPAAAFNSIKQAASKSLPKKVRTTGPVLQTVDIKKVKSVPDACQVLDAALQDPLLQPVYESGLPKLL